MKGLNRQEVPVTVEIAIMNREAVALAADSAVSLASLKGQRRMFPSGRKIFEVSADCPVGIMTYNTASFMDIPWDTVVALYRASLDGRRCDTLSQYGQVMVDVLNSLSARILPQAEELYLERGLHHLFQNMCGHVVRYIEDQEKTANKAIGMPARRRAILGRLDWALEKLSGLDDIGGQAGFEQVIDAKYGDLVQELGRYVFEKAGVPISRSSIAQRKLREIGTKLFTKDTEALLSERETESLFTDAEYSGLVIAGLGTHDLFPSLVTFRVRGALQGVAICQRVDDMCRSVGFDEPAAFMPFAQRDVIDTFRYGIRPDYTERVNERLIGLSAVSWLKYLPLVLRVFKGLTLKPGMADKLAEKMRDMLADTTLDFEYSLEDDRELDDERLEDFISVLPVSELAEMARTLVSFTCFHRKYTEFTGDDITVAEPVKVALISKNEGFRWVE